MSHIEVLEFELKALKAVLESQNMTLANYRRSYHHHTNVPGGSELQARASACVVLEYEQQSIPRTERHIAALEYVLEAIQNPVLWQVRADNHDYDYMSEWIVGVWPTEAEAEEAREAEEFRYRKEKGKNAYINVYVERVAVR